MKTILVLLLGALSAISYASTASGQTDKPSDRAQLCQIHPQDRHKQLTLGNVSTADFYRQGMTAGRKNFTIVLQNCPTVSLDNQTGQKKSLVSLSFSGEINSHGRLQNIHHASSASQGISMQLRHQGKALNLNDRHALTASLGESNDIRFDISAEYFAESAPVRAGDFFSRLTFEVNYK